MSSCPVCFDALVDKTSHGCNTCRNQICSSCFFQLEVLSCPLCRSPYHQSVKVKVLPDRVLSPPDPPSFPPPPLEIHEIIDLTNSPPVSPPRNRTLQFFR